MKTASTLTTIKTPLACIYDDYEDYIDTEYHADDSNVKCLSPDSLTIYSWMVECSINREITRLPEVYCVNDTYTILKFSIMRYASRLCRIDMADSTTLDYILRFVRGTFPVCSDIVHGMVSGGILRDNIQLILGTSDNPYSIALHNTLDLDIDTATYRRLCEIFSIVEESPASVFGTRNIWKNIYRMLLLFFADNILYGLVSAVSGASAAYSDHDKAYLLDTGYSHFNKAVKEYTAYLAFGVDTAAVVHLPGSIYVNRLVPIDNTDTGPYRNIQKNCPEFKGIVCKTRHRAKILSHIARLFLEEITGK